MISFINMMIKKMMFSADSHPQEYYSVANLLFFYSLDFLKSLLLFL